MAKQNQSSKSSALQSKRARSPNNEKRQTIRCNEIADSVVKSDSWKRKKFKRATEESLYETPEVQLSVLKRADEVAATLDHKFPTMVRVMLPSHVSGGFWFGIPTTFCKHLPKKDMMLVLEDENGEEFEAHYLVEKKGLSGGWKRFSVAHNLLPGDVLVFHLITKSKFKVYIIRNSGLGEVECAIDVVQLDAGTGPVDSADTDSCETAENENLEPTMSELLSEDTDNEDSGCEGLEGIRLAESVVPFSEVRRIQNFDVIVNGVILNPMLPKPILTKYYELCCSQNCYLHAHLLEGLNCNLAAGVICETTNIAEAIKACKITTLESSFSTWDKTLQACEILGMKVGFLRERLEMLASLSSKLNKCEEARLKRQHAEQEMRASLAAFLEVEEKADRLESEISEEFKSMFKEVNGAPW